MKADILHTIVATKKKEVAHRKQQVPVSVLESRPAFSRPVYSLKKAIAAENSLGIIAEFKRRSPSAGAINLEAKPAEVATGYLHGGVSGLSVLTDESFFGGSDADLEKVRTLAGAPILRKDFVIDPYQLVEARSLGADAVLLIAAILEEKQQQELTRLAHQLGLEVLLEIHSREELERHFHPEIDLLGVNSRNLRDFSVSLEATLRMADHIPSETLAIAESGISNPIDVLALRKAGYRGFLIGTRFMATSSPGKTCQAFTTELRKLQQTKSYF